MKTHTLKINSEMLFTFMVGVALSLAAMLFIQVPRASAATITWSGDACALDINDCGWSLSGNWAGGVAPVSGDDLVFDTAVTGTPVADISGLVVDSVTYTNSTPTPEIFTIRIDQPLTINGNIDTGTENDLLSWNLNDVTVTLGSNVSVIGSSGTFFVDNHALTTNNAVNLNGFALSFSATNATASVRVPITGNGTLNANTAGIINALVLRAVNTYSGTTNINGDIHAVGTSPFGTSNVFVAASGSIDFSSNSGSDTTISNQITMAGSTTISGLSFNGTPSTISYIVPNVILNGNVRFSNGVDTVDLTGVEANGFCASYFGNSSAGIEDGPANGFVGGPAGCVFSSSSDDPEVTTAGADVPGAPNTGFVLAMANPVYALLFSVAGGSALLVAARMRKISTKK